MKQGRGKTEISVYIGNEEDAEYILQSYNEKEEYLKDIIQKFVPGDTRKSVDEMDYGELLDHGRVIHGVAEKMIKANEILRKRTAREIEERKPKIEQMVLFR